jgi:hypothetical protein
MPGTARRVTIVILLLLMVVLAVVAFFIWNNSRNASRQLIAREGESCPAGTPNQCQAGTNGNTGNLCKCVQDGSSFRWNCSTKDLTSCPITGGAQCQPGEKQVGACGSSNCAAGEKPTQTCDTNGSFGAVVCIADASCTTTTTTSSSATSTGACSITAQDKTLSVGATCPGDFDYQVKKYVVTAPIGSTDASCATASFGAAETLSAVPGSIYKISDNTCGQCIKYELVSAPSGISTANLTVVGFSGICSASSPTSTVASSTASSATTSSQPGSLPATGLFDDPNNRPLLIGLILILAGLLVNRLFSFKWNTRP